MSAQSIESPFACFNIVKSVECKQLQINEQEAHCFAWNGNGNVQSAKSLVSLNWFCIVNVIVSCFVGCVWVCLIFRILSTLIIRPNAELTFVLLFNRWLEHTFNS